MTSGFNICLDLDAFLEAELIEQSKAQRQPMKPTCDASGNWSSRPAHEIDGDDKRVLRAAAADALNLMETT